MRVYRDVILVLCWFPKLISEVGLLVGFIRGVYSCVVMGLLTGDFQGSRILRHLSSNSLIYKEGT